MRRVSRKTTAQLRKSGSQLKKSGCQLRKSGSQPRKSGSSLKKVNKKVIEDQILKKIKVEPCRGSDTCVYSNPKPSCSYSHS
jgi:hypothetical protein